MTEYSEPRVGVTKYTIYPTGYDQSTFSDSYHFCIYVEQFHDTGRWYIHDGFRENRCTHKGTWVYENNLNKQWTRFDTAEEAIEVALKAVDNRPGNRNLVKAMEMMAARKAAEEKVSL
jgi:hypothetical protein